MLEPVTNMLLRAVDGKGHIGESRLFDVEAPPLTVMVPATATEGDGAVTGREDCDGYDLRSTDCQDLGFAAGQLGCSADCRFEVSSCAGGGSGCGDGVASGIEQCDGADIEFSCDDLGLGGGTIDCNADCTVNTDGCDGPGGPTVEQPGGVIDGGESWAVSSPGNTTYGIEFDPDVPGRVYGYPPPKRGPLAGLTVDEETLYSEYLTAMDWDLKTATPSQEKLLELGLDDVAKALRR